MKLMNSREKIYGAIADFISGVPSPPWVFNLYGYYGIGKYTMFNSCLSNNVRGDEIEVIDVTEQFSDDPKAFYARLNKNSYTPCLSGKIPIYLLRYPKVTKAGISILKKIMTPVMLITEEKIYKLGQGVSYMNFPSPSPRMYMSFLNRYIKENDLPKPPSPRKLMELIAKSISYDDLVSNLHTVLPDYNVSLIPDYNPVYGESDYKRLNDFFKGAEMPYTMFSNRINKEYVLYTILSSYKNINTRNEMLERLAFIDAHTREFSATYQQALVNSMVQKRPGKIWVEKSKWEPQQVPRKLMLAANKMCRGDPLRALSLFGVIRYIPTSVALDDKDKLEIMKYYKGVLR